MIRYHERGLGTVTASQISHGRENDIWIEVDGTKGSLEWHQEEPNKMFVRRTASRTRSTRAPAARTWRDGGVATRIPSGHPEGSLEAFANIYTAAYDDMIKRAGGQKFDGEQPLSERRRRRGRHELHHAVRRQAEEGGGVAVAAEHGALRG